MRHTELAGIDISIFVAYILAVLALGLLAARRMGRSKRDYFLAGDKLSWWMIGGSIVAANLSSHQFVGMTGAAYNRGFVVICAEWGAILAGFNALLWIFLPYYLREGFYTMPEFLQKRYGSAARSAYGVLIILIYIFIEISAVLYLGALALDELLGIPVMLSIILLAVLTAVYTITGGLRAVVWTEMLQLGVLLVGGMTLSVMALKAVGGWSALYATSPNWHILPPANDPDFPWTQNLGGGIAVSVFYCATNQFIVQRVLAARNEWHARMGVIAAQYIKLLLPIMTVIPGLCAAQLYPGLARPDLAFPTLVENLLPRGLIGLVMAGLIAAIMSHVSGALNSCSTIAAIDFYMPFFRGRASDKDAVRFGRITGIAVVILGIFWAEILIRYSDRPMFIYLMNAYGFFAPGIATMFLLGIFWKRATHAGALTAGALTVPLSIAIEKLAPLLPHNIGQYVTPFANRTGIVWALCMLACIVVSLYTKPKPEEELRGLIWTKSSLYLPKEQRAEMRGLRNPALWWALVTAVVLFMYVRFH